MTIGIKDVFAMGAALALASFPAWAQTNAQPETPPHPSPPAASSPVTSSTAPSPEPLNGPSPDAPREIIAARFASGPVEMSADTIHGTFAGQLEAHGSVTVTHQDVTIHADEMTFDLRSELLQALGHVRVDTPMGVLGANSLTYDLRTRASSGTALNARIGAFSLRAARFEVALAAPGALSVITAYDGAVTSCTFDHPDYLLSAHSIRLAQGRSLTVRGAAVSLFGARLITLPRITFDLRPRRRGEHHASVLPSFGYTSAAGPEMRFGSTAHLGPATTGRFTVALSEKLGISGSLTLTDVAGLPLDLTLARREEVPRYGHPYLTLDRLPEIGKSLRTDHQYAGGVVSLLGQASGGYYHEYRPGAQGTRILGRAAIVWQPAPTESHGVAGVGLSVAQYGGRNYSIGGVEIGYQTRLSDEMRGRLIFYVNGSRGHTPFRFDQLQTPTRVEFLVDSSNPAFGYTVDINYDLAGRHLNDLELSVAHTLKCIRPSIGYRFQSREILFGLSIPALEGLASRIRPGRAHPLIAPPVYTWNDGDSLPTPR
ncbi:MAG TPA: hypothetical protein VFJ58_01640 [Armatimonadota bacterium]|nr:hypothetical protein [Armatimonadota bacterium]